MGRGYIFQWKFGTLTDSLSTQVPGSSLSPIQRLSKPSTGARHPLPRGPGTHSWSRVFLFSWRATSRNMLVAAKCGIKDSPPKVNPRRSSCHSPFFIDMVEQQSKATMAGSPRPLASCSRPLTAKRASPWMSRNGSPSLLSTSWRTWRSTSHPTCLQMAKRRTSSRPSAPTCSTLPSSPTCPGFCRSSSGLPC